MQHTIIIKKDSLSLSLQFDYLIPIVSELTLDDGLYKIQSSDFNVMDEVLYLYVEKIN